MHIALLNFHLWCNTRFNLVQNAKIMRKEVGAYMNHEAYEIGDVWH